MNTPEGLLYSKEHEWLKVDGSGKFATLGITDYAQDQLGDVVFVDLPGVGDEVEVGGTLASLESVKAVSEVYSPVDGRVGEANQELVDRPETINEDPYGKGWIVKLELSDPEQLETLMSAAEYAGYVAEEAGG